MIGEELPGRPGGSEVVDYGHPDVRVEAERPDLADQFTALDLELAFEGLLICGRGHLNTSDSLASRRTVRASI